MTPPGICIFTETYHPEIGGGETQARLLAEGLVTRGFPVIILTRRSDPASPPVEQNGAVTVYRLPPTGRGQHKKWGLLLSSFPALLRLHHHYDLLFVSGFRIVGLSAVLISKLLRKPCVLKADSQGEMSGDFFAAGLAKLGRSSSWLPFRLFLALRNALLRRANAFAAITAGTATELRAAGVPEKAIHMIPNSVDTTRFCPVREPQKHQLRHELGIPLANRVVIYTGRLVSYKGLPLLLRVWQQVALRHERVQLLLVGSGGLDIHNCEEELHTFVTENNLHRHVSFTGSVQNVQDYLQAADVFVLPSENDAFPSSLVEAMSCGLPVIATPVGAIETIVQDRANGLLVQPGSFEQLAAALDTLLTDRELAARLGEAGWQTVQEHYSAETVTRQYMHLFCALTG